MSDPVDPKAVYIACATTHFAANGYGGTSLAAVARSAGVTKQALLHFFGSKEKLYAAVLSALADQLCAGVDAAHCEDPARHLERYFCGFQAQARDAPDPIRLVVRALLDSHSNARVWPLKPYLQSLIVLVQQTEGVQDRSRDEIFAWLAQIIGSIQYSAISGTAMTGMFGQDIWSATMDRAEERLKREIREFLR